MSDILEALRKVELQRNNSRVPGITTRQRYYTARSKHTWMRPAFIMAAGLIVASLSAAAGIYLARITDEEPLAANTPTPETAAPAARVAAPPVTVKDFEREVPLVRPSYKEHAAPQQTTLQTSVTLPPPLPGPRRHKEVVHPPINELMVTQSAQPVQTPPQPTEREKSPVEETAPKTQEPATPAREQETAVASTGVLRAETIKPAAARTAVIQKRSVYNAIPSQAEVLEQIKPPAGVEVKPFRPNDVIRPPASRKTQPVENEPPMLSTLSSQFQSMVPKMTINAQVYSAAQPQRFVVINMKRYNEGQKTAEGVTIESIRKNDIIFVYQGQQFRLSR